MKSGVFESRRYRDLRSPCVKDGIEIKRMQAESILHFCTSKHVSMENMAIVIFDGTCNFCNASVRFMIANDPAGYFRFAASQSDAGIAALRDRGRDPATVESIVLIDDVGVHEHSNAALGIAAGLVARNRYRWFGRRESCAIASPAERARFL